MDLESRTREYYSAVDRGDVDAVVEWFAEDATYRRPGYPAMHGRRVLSDFYRNDRVIEDGEHRLDLLVVQDSSVAVRGVFQGRLKDGSQVSLGFADFITYDDEGHARDRRSYFEVPAV